MANTDNPNQAEAQPVDARYSLSSEKWEETNKKRYCCGKLSKLGCFILLFLLALVSAACSAVAVWYIANNIIKNSKIIPTEISMEAAGFDTSGNRRLQDSVNEFVKLTVNAAVTNSAILGGVLQSTKMDCYLKTTDAQGKPHEMLAITFTIPETEVGSQIEDVKVQICSEKEQWEDGICTLRDLSETDLDRLHQMVEIILEQDYIDMKMVAPEGVKLKAFGIPIPFTFNCEKDFRVRGFNGALNEVSIENFSIEGKGDDLAFVSDAVLHNPSQFGFTLIPAQFGLYIMKNDSMPEMASCPPYIYLGKAISNVTTYLGPDTVARITLSGKMDRDANTDCINNFLERYLNGKPNTVIARIERDATASKYLNGILGGTDMQATMATPLTCRGNPKGCDLVTHVDNTDVAFNNPIEFFQRVFNKQKPTNLIKRVYVDMSIYNPFLNTKLRTTKYNLQIMYKGVQLGKITRGPTDLIVNGGKEGTIPLEVTGLNDDQNDFKRQMNLACDLLVDECYVDAGPETNFEADVGAFHFKVGYVQPRIKITCKMNSILQKGCDMVMNSPYMMSKVRQFCTRFTPLHRAKYLKERTTPSQLPQ